MLHNAEKVLSYKVMHLGVTSVAGEICETLLQCSARTAAERWHGPIVRSGAKRQLYVIDIDILVARLLGGCTRLLTRILELSCQNETFFPSYERDLVFVMR
jgi:hypothetical protein